MYGFLKKNRHLIHPIEAFVMLLCTLIDAALIFGFGSTEQSGTPLIGLGINFVGVMLCCILFSALYMDKNTTLHMELFMFILMLECMTLTIDSTSWLLDGNTNYETINSIGRYLKRFMLMVMAIVFWHYLRNSIEVERKSRIWSIAQYALFATSMVLLATNVFTGTLFSISGGSYSHGPLITLFFAIYILMLTVGVLYELFSSATRREKFVSVIYLIVSIAFLFVHLTYFGISLIYFSPMIIIVILYVNFYTMRCADLAQRESQYKSERYSLMVSQVQPHFLYNSLSSIMAIKEMPPLAQEAIMEFSTVLRNNLEMLECDSPIPFSEELEHTESYLYLEKLRFKSKLNISMEVEDTRFMIPPMALQALAENAIRHGITKKVEGGTLRIITKRNEDCHILQIIDDGVGFEPGNVAPDEKPHIGLTVIRKRLSDMLGGTLNIESTPGQGTWVTITIPIH